MEETTEITNDDPSWYAMQQCQIMLPLAQLLQLVPRFTENLKSALSPPKPATTTTFFTNPSKALEVVDTNSPALTVIIKGNEVTGAIINVGFNINVINKKTCDTLGIWEWEPCPLCLRMADTNSVRRTRLIQNVEITIVGHVFRISAFVLN